MLEVEEQPVGAATGHLGIEGYLRTRGGLAVAGGAVGVYVQVGQVSGAQRDQVAVGAEVGLQVGDRLAVLADLEGELAGPAGGQVAEPRG